MCNDVGLEPLGAIVDRLLDGLGKRPAQSALSWRSTITAPASWEVQQTDKERATNAAKRGWTTSERLAASAHRTNTFGTMRS